MLTEEEFKHSFWNKKLEELQKINMQMPDVKETVEQFINRFDDIAIENEVTSFGYTETVLGGVRIVIELNLGPGKHFELIINWNSTQYYLEVNLLHENSKEFLTNTFFQKLPYTVVGMLIKTMRNLEEEYAGALLEYRKQEKLVMMTKGTIKALLIEKFKNTKYDWKIKDIDTEVEKTYVIILRLNNDEISRLFVTNKDYIQKIIGWEI